MKNTRHLLYVGKFTTSIGSNIDKGFFTKKSAYAYYRSQGYSYSKELNEFYKRGCSVRFIVCSIDIHN